MKKYTEPDFMMIVFDLGDVVSTGDNDISGVGGWNRAGLGDVPDDELINDSTYNNEGF